MDFSPLALCGMDRAAKSPSLSALSRPWNISSLPRMKEMEKESEREGGKNEGCVCEREKQRKKRKQNSVYGSGCLWNNFPYQCNCMSPVGKGIWFSPYSANGKEELESKQERRMLGRERESTCWPLHQDSRTGTVVSRSFLVRKHTNHHSVILPEPVWSIQ